MSFQIYSFTDSFFSSSNYINCWERVLKCPSRVTEWFAYLFNLSVFDLYIVKLLLGAYTFKVFRSCEELTNYEIVLLYFVYLSSRLLSDVNMTPSAFLCLLFACHNSICSTYRLYIIFPSFIQPTCVFIFKEYLL